MRKALIFVALIPLALTGAAYAGIVDDVRDAVSQNNFTLAESEVQTYKSQHGATPECAEAISWIARGALQAQQFDTADRYAKEAQALSVAQLNNRRLDSDPSLATALGASYEVQAQVLAAKGEHARAVTLLQTALRAYGTTSIRPRLQKNLNLLSLVGRPAPVLREDQYLGAQLKPLAESKGSAVLLFFWAHWCGDCKYEAPIITRLRSEYASKGLTVVAPTKLYGYAARGEDATPRTEVAWIDTVRKQFYSGLLDVPVPISKYNFDMYGASTTPTLVVVNRKGAVDLYHPGLMSYDDLRAAIDKALAR